jgi:hypothetical protein
MHWKYLESISSVWETVNIMTIRLNKLDWFWKNIKHKLIYFNKIFYKLLIIINNQYNL